MLSVFISKDYITTKKKVTTLKKIFYEVTIFRNDTFVFNMEMDM